MNIREKLVKVLERVCYKIWSIYIQFNSIIKNIRFLVVILSFNHLTTYTAKSYEPTINKAGTIFCCPHY